MTAPEGAEASRRARRARRRRRAFSRHGQMLATGDDDASKPDARVRHVSGDEYEIYGAGQSDGTSAGDVAVGWGATALGCSSDCGVVRGSAKHQLADVEDSPSTS